MRTADNRRTFIACLLIALVVALTGGRCGGGEDDESAKPERSSSDYAEAPAKYLERPFTGAAVPNDWTGNWHNSAVDIDWHILEARSPECRALTGGRTTCFTFGPVGTSTQASDLLAGGAITLRGGRLILRMTYTSTPGSPGCLVDDSYRYRYTMRTIELLKDDRRHCFWERGEGDARKFAVLERDT